MAAAGSGCGLAQLAEALGSSEQALRLILSILMDNLDVVQQSITFPNACGKEAISFQLQGSLNHRLSSRSFYF